MCTDSNAKAVYPLLSSMYKKATTKVGKKWPRVSEYVRTGNVPVDKKLF